MTATAYAPPKPIAGSLQLPVETYLAVCKQHPRSNEIPVELPGYACVLRPLGEWCLDQPELIRHMTEWRKRNQMAFPSIFNVTYQGTLAWFKKRVMEDPERILYGVFDANECMIAHAGLASFDWRTGEGEIDNIMRGDDTAPKGLMTAVVNQLVHHAYEELGLRGVGLRVFGDNWRAIKLYLQCGFKPVESIPVSCIFNDTGLSWQTCDTFESGKTFRIFLRMKHEQQH